MYSYGSLRVGRSNLVAGQIFKAFVSMQTVLYEFAGLLGENHNIQLTSNPPDYDPTDGSNYRPCIYLFRSPLGIHVLPMATFKGSDPIGWNSFLQEIVVPVGERVWPMFANRRSFETTPGWKHPGNWASYVVPHVIVLPSDTPVPRLRPTMPGDVVRELLDHCDAIRERLSFGSSAHLRSLLRSYEEMPTGTYRTTSGISEEPSASDSSSNAVSPPLHGVSAGGIVWGNGPASFPDLARSQYSGPARSSASRSTVAPYTPSASGHSQALVSPRPSRLR